MLKQQSSLVFLLAIYCFLAFTLHTYANAQQSIESRMPKRRAFATLLEWDEHAVGVRTLDFSLRKSNNTEDLIVLYTPNVSHKTIEYLKTHSNLLPGNTIHYKLIFKEVQPIVYQVTKEPFNLLHLWKLTDYDRIIFLDTDALVVDNLDILFLCGKFCAAGDLPAPEYGNLGVLSMSPSLQQYEALLTYMHQITVTPQPFVQNQQSFFNRFHRWNESVRFHWEDIATRSPQPQDQVYTIDTYWNNLVPLYYVYRPGWYYNLRKMKVATHDFPWKAWDWWTYPSLDLNYEWYYYPFFLQLPNNPYAHPVLPLAFPFLLAAAVAYAMLRLAQRAQNAPSLMPALLIRLHNTVLPTSRNTPALLALPCMAAMVYNYHYHINYTDWDPYWSWAVLHGYLFLTAVLVVGTYSLILYWKTVNSSNYSLPLTLSTGNSSAALTSVVTSSGSGSGSGSPTNTQPASAAIPATTGSSTASTPAPAANGGHPAYANFTPPITAAPKWMYLQIALLLVLPVVLYAFVVYRVHQAFGDIAHHAAVIIFAIVTLLVAWVKCFREFPMFVYFYLTPHGARRSHHVQKD